MADLSSMAKQVRSNSLDIGPVENFIANLSAYYGEKPNDIVIKVYKKYLRDANFDDAKSCEALFFALIETVGREYKTLPGIPEIKKAMHKVLTSANNADEVVLLEESPNPRMHEVLHAMSVAIQNGINPKEDKEVLRLMKEIESGEDTRS